jgi:hypothetical protein
VNNTCVYCGKDVGREIKRKMDCPYCKKTLYIRRGKVVDEREKEIFDWQKYMDFLVPDIESVRTTVEKKLTERFRQQPSAHDLIWGMFNYIVIHLRKPIDLETIYTNMAQFLESEGKIKHAVEIRRQANKMKIASFLESDFYEYVRVKNYEDDFVCAECKKENDMIIPIKEAFKDPILPIHNCSNKKCRCRFEFISKYDDEYKKLGTKSIEIKSEISIAPINKNTGKNKVHWKLVISIVLVFMGLITMPGGILFWIIALFLYLSYKKKNIIK